VTVNSQKVTFFPIEKAAIESLSNANRQEYEYTGNFCPLAYLAPNAELTIENGERKILFT